MEDGGEGKEGDGRGGGIVFLAKLCVEDSAVQ